MQHKMSIREFQKECQKLLRKHYLIDISDTWLTEPEIVDSLIKAGQTSDEAVGEFGRQRGLIRVC